MIIKARVVDLLLVPQFIVYSETQGMESDSWTVQCEVLQSRLLGGGPQDEDPLPEAPFAAGSSFDFLDLVSLEMGHFQTMMRNKMRNRMINNSLRNRSTHLSKM